MSDRMTALDVKKMAADKNGIEEDVVSRWHLVASVERGGERLKFILPDDYFPLSICTNSADSNVRFSLKWSKGTGGLSHRGADDISKSSTSDGRRSNEDQHHVGTCKPEEEMDRRFRNGDMKTLPRSNRNVSEFIVHYEPSPLKRGDPKNPNDNSEVPIRPRAGYLSGTSSGTPYLSNGGPVPSTGSQYQYGAFRVPMSISRVPGKGVLPGDRCSERKEEEEEERVVETEVNRLGNENEASKRRNTEKTGNGFEEGGDPDRKSNPVAPEVETGDRHQESSRISSLPNMDEMEARTTALERTGSSNSLPSNFRDPGRVNSTEGGGGGGGRRCLPQLQVPDAIVEERRSILSQKLERKLESFCRRKTKKKKRRGRKKNGYPGSSSGPDVRPTRPPGGEDSDDDDCMSVTSWEVAEILAEAEPMAPKDSDYEDSDNTSDDDDDHHHHVRDGGLLASDSRFRGTHSSDADTLEDGSRSSDDDKFSPIHRKEKTGSEHYRKCSGSSPPPPPPPSFVRSDPLAKPLPLSRGVPPEKKKVPSCDALGPARKVPSLCRLMSGSDFRFRISILSAKSSSAIRLPFQVFNDVIYLVPVSGGHVSSGKAGRERFVVPVIGDSSDSPGDKWECLEGSVESGDIIVEVNGKITLQETATAIVRTCLDCCNDLQLVLARRKSSRRGPRGSEN